MHVPGWLIGSAAFYVASSAVRALPDPAPSGSTFYLWLFKFTHLLLANFDKLRPAGPEAKV